NVSLRYVVVPYTALFVFVLYAYQFDYMHDVLSAVYPKAVENVFSLEDLGLRRAEGGVPLLNLAAPTAVFICVVLQYRAMRSMERAVKLRVQQGNVVINARVSLQVSESWPSPLCAHHGPSGGVGGTDLGLRPDQDTGTGLAPAQLP